VLCIPRKSTPEQVNSVRVTPTRTGICGLLVEDFVQTLHVVAEDVIFNTPDLYSLNFLLSYYS